MWRRWRRCRRLKKARVPFVIPFGEALVSSLNAGYFLETLGGMMIVVVVVDVVVVTAHELNATRAGGSTSEGEIGAAARGLHPSRVA